MAEVARSSSGRSGGAPELQARLAEQATTIEELRREVSWLTEELVARQANGNATTAGDDGLPAGWLPMLHALRRLVHRCVPRGSRIAVVSSGVEPLLRIAGYRAEHLSQDSSGEYAGSHPSCDRAAVVQLEAARWRGAEFLLLPHSELWWLEHYTRFAGHLDHRYARFAAEDEAGVIWDLRAPRRLSELHDLLSSLWQGLDHRPAILDWRTGVDLQSYLAEYKVFSPLGDGPVLPYLDATVDVVALGDETVVHASEARRVASALVVHVVSGPEAEVDVLWRAERGDGCDGVSVVVPLSDRRPPVAGFAERLLASLPPAFAGEVVFDAACGEIPRGSRAHSARPRIRRVRCPKGARYGARLRRCAEAASGDVLVALDSATWPLPGWLRPLVHLVREVADAGFVTGMSVGPNGDLVGPASLVGDEPGAVGLSAPRLTHVRRLETASAGFFATRRRLFLGWEGCLEGDVAESFGDYARASGRAVLYEPEAVAVVTAGPPRFDAGLSGG